jgi:hypothetical protein
MRARTGRAQGEERERKERDAGHGAAASHGQDMRACMRARACVRGMFVCVCARANPRNTASQTSTHARARARARACGDCVTCRLWGAAGEGVCVCGGGTTGKGASGARDVSGKAASDHQPTTSDGAPQKRGGKG